MAKVPWSYPGPLPRNQFTDFPLSKILIINEAVDCSHPSLTAVIFSRDESSIPCRALQVHVALQLESSDGIQAWSDANMYVDILGLRDFHGNLYGPDGQISKVQSSLDEIITRKYRQESS